MAQEIRQYSITIQPNTQPGVATVQDMTFPPRIVMAVEVTVPPGSNGLVGFQIQNSHVLVIPYDSDEWIVTNDEKIHWDLQGYIDSGSWQVAAYNLGAKPHTLYFRWLLAMPNPSPAVTPPIGAPLSVLSNLPTVTAGG